MTSFQRVLGTAIGVAAQTFVDSAGRMLEADQLPPDDHRPWPVPATPWAMTQTWEHVLFAHWPVPRGELEARVPRGLRIDTFRGIGWLGVVAFRVSGARMHGLPAIPGFSEFAEVNVRTYVTAGGKPGVYFFSLDAGSALTVLGASAWYALPYFLADARVSKRGELVRFRSRREHAGAPAAEFVADYRPASDARRPARSALARWLTERYCAYSKSADGVMRTEIHHAPWPLQRAEVRVHASSLLPTAGFAVTEPPRLAHYAERVDARIWPPVTLESPRAA